MAAPVVLGGMWLWGYLDGKLTAYHNANYKPVPISSTPAFTTKDVTIIVTTLAPPAVFGECLQHWLSNDPLELIIVTTDSNMDKVWQAIAAAGLTDYQASMLDVLAIEDKNKGKRTQYIHGVKHAQGRIIAGSDDQILWGDEFLKYMIPCFDDDTVGAAGPFCDIYIPEDRQHPDIITPWEVAGARHIAKGMGGGGAMYAAARWTWHLGGYTTLYRASIVQDPEFLDGFANDYWRGKRMDVGEDTFISRWTLQKGYTIAIQYMAQTTVRRSVKRTPAYVAQLLRWERSTIQSFLRTVRDVPKMRESGYVTRRTIERICKAPLLVIHLVAWIISLYQYPVFTLLLLAYYLSKTVPGLIRFFNMYPYMKRYWWAAVLSDHSGIVISVWAILTLSDTTWIHGEGTYTANAKVTYAGEPMPAFAAGQATVTKAEETTKDK